MSVQIVKPDNIIDLGVGQPDPDLLPVRLFQSAALEWKDLAYGDMAGDLQFRRTLAQWLTTDYGHDVHAEQLMVTNGSSNAVDMICTQFAGRGATVLVEDPTYFIALNLFAEHGIKVEAVPMDEYGLRPDALEEAIQLHQPAFVYTIPSFHNPTGITQPAERRKALVGLAKQYDCPLVADEVYQSLFFHQKPPPPLACYDIDAPVLSIGTFSKILAPGLRLGWIQGAGTPIRKLLDSALLKSGGGLAPVTSALVEPLIAEGEFQRYLVGLRQTYQQRMDVLYSGLHAALGDRLCITKPEGGYFVWATLCNGDKPVEKLAIAKKAGVSYLSGNVFSTSAVYDSSMRLCFAWYTEKELQQACDRLANVFV